MNRKTCEGCKYYRFISQHNGGEKGCHYFHDTYNLRGCSPENCDKKETKKTEKGKRKNQMAKGYKLTEAQK